MVSGISSQVPAPVVDTTKRQQDVKQQQNATDRQSQLTKQLDSQRQAADQNVRQPDHRAADTNGGSVDILA